DVAQHLVDALRRAVAHHGNGVQGGGRLRLYGYGEGGDTGSGEHCVAEWQWERHDQTRLGVRPRTLATWKARMGLPRPRRHGACAARASAGIRAGTRDRFAARPPSHPWTVAWS